MNEFDCVLIKLYLANKAVGQLNPNVELGQSERRNTGSVL